MTPNEFLHVLVDALVDRLQERECVGLPGIGCLRPDPAHPDAVEFLPGDSADSDAAVTNLAQAISRRTGHDVASVAVGLSRFSVSARRFLDEHGRLELPGIGDFHGPSGAYGFVPSPELLTALGWEGRSEPEPALAGSEPVSEASSWTPHADTGSDPDAPAFGREGAGATGTDYRPEPLLERADHAGGFTHETAEDADDVPPEVVDAVIEQANLPPLTPKTPHARRRGPERRGRNSFSSPMVIGALAVVVILTVLIVLVSRRSAPVPSALTPATDSSAARIDGAAADSVGPGPGDSTLVAEVLTAPTVNRLPVTEVAPAAPQPAPTEPSAAEARPVPVSGSGDFDTARAGYTLITGSTTRSADARRSADSVRDFGFPVAVLAYDENGTTRFRVGLGIFPTLAVADSVRLALADRLPTGTWIRRIRP